MQFFFKTSLFIWHLFGFLVVLNPCIFGIIPKFYYSPNIFFVYSTSTIKKEIRIEYIKELITTS